MDMQSRLGLCAKGCGIQRFSLFRPEVDPYVERNPLLGEKVCTAQVLGSVRHETGDVRPF